MSSEFQSTAGTAGQGTETPLLELRDLEKTYRQSSSLLTMLKARLLGDEESRIRAVDGVDLSVAEREVHGIIGESGCGKTTLLETVAGLEPPSDGQIRFDGQDTADFGRSEWKSFRQRVQIIFQNPFDSLDPKQTVGETLMEPLKIHRYDRRDERVREMLRRVELNPPEQYLDTLPRRLSGGEKQRVSIARALVLEPDLILADEPVSMLDVSTQAALLQLLRELTEDLDMAMVYISHDLSTVSYVCDEVNVMYLGRIVESAPTADLIHDPKHPYTRALVNAVPFPDPTTDRDRTALSGTPSDPSAIPTGCRFKDRCPERMDVCDRQPAFLPIEGGDDRMVACHLHGDEEGGG